MKPWTPPKTLVPITAPTYAMLRVYIDASAAAVQHYAQMVDGGCKSECWTEPRPTVQAMARTLYKHIPLGVLPREPAQAFAAKYYPGDTARSPDTDLEMVGWPSFVDRQAAIAALDAATPPAVLAEIGPLSRTPEAGEGTPDGTVGGDDPGASLNWWVIALSSSGFLSWLGKSKVLAALSPSKKLVTLILVAATALKYLGLGGAVAEIWEGSKKVIDEVVVKPAAKGASVAFYILGGAVGVIGAVVVYKAVNKPRALPARSIT